MQYRWISGDGEERACELLADLCNIVRVGEIATDTLVRVGEDGRWTPAGRHPDIAPILALLHKEKEAAPPPARPQSPPVPQSAPAPQSPLPREPQPVEEPPLVVEPEEEIVDAVVAPRAAMPERPVDVGGAVTVESAYPTSWKLAMFGFAAATIVDIACYVFTDVLNDWARGRDPVAFWNNIGRIRIGCFALGGLGFMFGVAAAHEFLTARGYSNFRIRPWVANVCLFVPLAGLVVPWMFWGDVRRESVRFADHGPFGGGLPPKHRMPSAAAAGLGILFLLYILGVAASNSIVQGAKTITAFQQGGYVLIGSDLVFFGALWLFFRSINKLWRIGSSAPRVRATSVEAMA